jgi:hypothetical protein
LFHGIEDWHSSPVLLKDQTTGFLVNSALAIFLSHGLLEGITPNVGKTIGSTIPKFTLWL